MITGRLVDVNGNYYAILNLKHPDGKRLQNRFNLELPVANNKCRAQEKLHDLCMQYTRKQWVEQNSKNVVLMDFIQAWIEQRKPEISPSTYRSYKHMADRYMHNYFYDLPFYQISFWNIEDYYGYLLYSGLSSTTVQHHHGLLKTVFYEANRRGIISENPMEFVKRPKREQPKVSYYTLEEAQRLIEEVKGTKNLYSQPQTPPGRVFSRHTMLNFLENTSSIPAKICLVWRENPSTIRHFRL